MDKRRMYGEISKVEPQEDGTIKVWGYASSQAVDSQGEVITADAMKAALPDYLKFANVREMHQAKAAGVCIEATVQEDGRTFFGAHVVDKEAVQKVQTKVYKGFSIGGRVTKRDEKVSTIITGIQLNEVSLVDRPANPDSVFTVFKIDDVVADEALAVDELSKVIGDVIKASDLLKLAKDAIAKTPKGVAEKGMYSVAILAGILSDLNDLRSMTEYEASYEGDGSKVPVQLREMVDALAGVLTAMVAEETAELTADSKAMAAFNEGLAKLAPEKITVTAVQEACVKAGMGEGEQYSAFISKLAKSVADLTAEVTALGKRVEQPRGAVKVVAKGDDIGSDTDPNAPALDAPVLKADGTVDQHATALKLIKLSHKNGVRAG